MKEKLTRWLSGLSGNVNKAKRQLSSTDQPREKGKIRLQNPIRSVGVMLFLLFFISIVAMVVFAGVLSTNISKSIITDKVSTASEETIIQASDKLDYFLESLENSTVQIMSDDVIAENLNKYRDKTLTAYDKLQAGSAVNTRLKNYVMSNSKIADVNIVPIAIDSDSYKSNTSMKDSVYQSAWLEEIKKGDGKAVWLPTLKAGYRD
ncbi:MAG: methyl-accepting chemotaxis sensory transducer [Paenibacillus sp.]|nr:methyl-accepting chemotaxis sensory transducer [Paenibacillus sp.]